MKTGFYFNGKKITKKAATEMLGSRRLEQMLREAKEAFFEDPYEIQSWFIGTGILEIRFS